MTATTSPRPTTAGTGPHDRIGDRVPVEHRFLGVDRRTLPLALVAAGVWLLWAVVLPFIDARVPWDDEISAGDVIQVSEDVTFTPTTGWGLQDGLRTTDQTLSGDVADTDVVLVNDGVAFAVQPGPWSGTAAELLQQVDDVPTIGTGGAGDPQLTGEPTTIETNDGTQGVSQHYVTPVSNGIAIAFAVDGEGVLIEVIGTPEHLSQQSQDIADMVESFRFGDAS